MPYHKFSFISLNFYADETIPQEEKTQQKKQHSNPLQTAQNMKFFSTKIKQRSTNFN